MHGQVPFRVDTGCKKLLLQLGCLSLCACGMVVLRGKQISLKSSGCGLSSHFSYEEV